MNKWIKERKDWIVREGNQRQTHRALKSENTGAEDAKRTVRNRLGQTIGTNNK